MNDTGDSSEDLEELRKKHRELDEQIAALDDDPTSDQLRIQRLKRQKLTLKDKISHLEASLLPDIIA